MSPVALVHPVTTRTDVTERDGLAAGIAALAPFAPPALVLEAGAAQSLRAARSAVQRAGRAVLAIIGAPFAVPSTEGDDGSASDPYAPLDGATPAESDAAGNALILTLGACAGLRCRRVVVPASGVTFNGNADQEVDAYCRRLHHLARGEPGVRWLIMPSANPEALLTPERCEWVLDDVPASNVGLAVDLGVLGLRAARGGAEPGAWFERLGARVDLVLIADSDGVRSDLPAGMGSLDLRCFADGIGRHVPRVLRGAADLPSAVCFEQADRSAQEAFGTPPDLTHLV